MMRALMIAALLTVLLVVPARADTIVKRVRTSKAQVVRHIKTTRALGTGREGVVTTVTRWSCKGYHKSKSGKAKTWRCVLWSGECQARFRLGKVRRVNSAGAAYDSWLDERLAAYRCPAAP